MMAIVGLVIKPAQLSACPFHYPFKWPSSLLYIILNKHI